MRAVLVLGVIACAACNDPSSGYGDPYGPSCHADADCSNGDVCSHNGGCFPAAQLRTIRAMWTINGAAADATTCAGLSMVLSFDELGGGYGNDISFEPVACAQGQFTLDKMPISYNTVRLEAYTKTTFGQAQMAVDSSTGDATLDLELM